MADRDGEGRSSRRSLVVAAIAAGVVFALLFPYECVVQCGRECVTECRSLVGPRLSQAWATVVALAAAAAAFVAARRLTDRP